MNYIIFEDQKIYIDSINNYVPFTITNNSIVHAKVCDFIAKKYFNYESKSLDHKLTVNFLYSKSLIAKNITSVILLSKKKKISLINSNYLTEEFEKFFDYKISFSIKKNRTKNFIKKSQLIISVAKYFVHSIFRLLKRRNLIPKTNMVRSFADYSYRIYGERYKTDTIYIYPFTGSFFRGYKYLRKFKQLDNVSTMGLPYRLTNLLRLINFKNYDKKIIDYERQAYIDHAKELSLFQTVFTSDEFEPASYVLYEKLKAKTKIINHCHGIGNFNPFLNYNKIILLNNKQEKYYSLFNEKMEMSVLKEKIVPKKFSEKNRNALVIIDQGNLRNYGLNYEDSLQRKLYKKLHLISKEDGIACFIKFHPNRSKKSINKICNNYNFEEKKKISDLGEFNLIFINLFSTAYYDFAKNGKFIFIEDDLFNPKELFGDKIVTSTITNLKKNIEISLKC